MILIIRVLISIWKSEEGVNYYRGDYCSRISVASASANKILWV